jgi:MoaA/NifB/PqqE/SkfB family radical SAM enzyme
MCDIWKGNNDRKQLNKQDIEAIIISLKKLDTRRVLMSGGEALLNKNFFEFCRLLNKEKLRVTLLSTGMTLGRHAQQIAELVDEVIISLDGDEKTHDAIRNIPNAYDTLKKGIMEVRKADPDFRITGRSVIHRLNYRKWPQIVLAAKELGLHSISFLPADVTSEAFNRDQPWDRDRRESVLIPLEELRDLSEVIETLSTNFAAEFASHFILESPDKIRKIHTYYSAHHGLNDFPEKKCNAPWVSAVIEADGSLRPCFFHDVAGNVRNTPLHELINSDAQLRYRKQLDVATNETCKRCVCFLNLPPRQPVS